jgi:hypothetical protein
MLASALATSAIKVTFPNTKHSCGDGQVGSCSNTTKLETWVAYKDVFRRGTMQHELAHQIHSVFWPANKLQGSGGAHFLKECSNKGMALSEGFADFAPVWVQASRNEVPYGDFGFDIESPNGNCNTNNISEIWVAGTFWDMHDTVRDGQDTVYWSSNGAVMAVFLGSHGWKGGQKITGMSDFQSIYADLAGKHGAQY